jgi:hypothetical protein
MFLVRADKQSGGKRRDIPPPSFPGGAGEAKEKAIPAPLLFMSHHCPEIGDHLVVLGYNKRQILTLSPGLHCLQAALVLGKGMNVGVIPEKRHPVTLLPPVMDTVSSAMDTAGMKKQAGHSIHQKLV